MKLRRCTKCGVEKDLADFYRDARGPLGRARRCKACKQEYARNWRQALPPEGRDALNEHDRKYQARNKDRGRTRGKARRSSPEYRARQRDYSLRRKYGKTLEDVKVMIGQQHGRCAICGNGFLRAREPCVDHDHATGRVRALLCLTCNIMLGSAYDNPDILRKGTAYLEKWQR